MTTSMQFAATTKITHSRGYDKALSIGMIMIALVKLNYISKLTSPQHHHYTNLPKIMLSPRTIQD